MNPAIYLLCFLPIIIILFEQRTQEQNTVARRIVNKRREEDQFMFEFVKSFIGETCIVATMNSQLRGVIVSVEDGWITVESKSGVDAVNPDYVISIRKNNKKPSKVASEDDGQ